MSLMQACKAVYRPYPRRLESLTVCRCLNKGSTFPQLFKDPECWSGRDLNQRPPARQTGAYPTELEFTQAHSIIIIIIIIIINIDLIDILYFLLLLLSSLLWLLLLTSSCL